MPARSDSIRSSTSQPIRVLQVIQTLGMGGAERMILDLLDLLSPTGEFEFHLCVLGPTNESFYDGFARHQPPEFLGYHGAYRDAPATAGCVAKLRRVISQFKPDVLHTHLWISDFVGALASRGMSCRQISHIHCMWDWYKRETAGFKFRHALYRASLAGSRARFISVSEAARQYTHEHLWIPLQRIQTIPIGIDIARFSPTRTRRANETVVIGAAGRFVAEKNHELLLRAAAELISQGVNLTVRIAGDGPLREQYRDLANQLNIRAYFELPGSVRDINAFYNGLDIFVQPSRSEGMPLTLIEAMSAGLPVIATNAGGTVEVVRDGVDGLITPTEDVTALARAIHRLAGSSRERERLATSARERAIAAFDRKHMASRVAEVYRAAARR